MKLSHITPTRFIKEFGVQSDFILALSHLMETQNENEYEVEIKKTNLPIILDNGLFENHTPEPIESLVLKAIKIGATHFFAPDVLYNATETQKELERAIKLKNELNAQVEIAAVVQANNSEDYFMQLLDFNNNPEVGLIGLSILSVPKSFYKEVGEHNITSSRMYLLMKMKEMVKQGVVWKNCHMLGLGDSYDDVLYAKENCPWVVSNDTSCAFQSGLFGRELTEDLEVPGGKVKEKVDFELSEINEEQRDIIQKNINKIKDKIYDI